MRKFSYITDYVLINSSVRGYITELEKELAMLIDMEVNNGIYIDTYKKLKEFKSKYSDLHGIYNRILNDLTSGDNVEYCFKYGKYKDDASLVGLEFEKDLKEIFELEEKCRDYSIKLWERDITNYDNITNGEDFMTVIHASYLEPGVKGELNYHDNEYSKQYLSCSLISDRELNTFGDAKTLFVMDVNSDSYIASSFVDSAFFTFCLLSPKRFLSANFNFAVKSATLRSAALRLRSESFNEDYRESIRESASSNLDKRPARFFFHQENPAIQASLHDSPNQQRLYARQGN